jgi:hypothetical protein
MAMDIVFPTSSGDDVRPTIIDERNGGMVMKLKKWMSISGIVGAIAIFSMAACSSDKNKGVAAGDGAVSNVTAALSGADFNGNSVFIVAHRNNPADSKYPCVNDASGCFNFGPVPDHASNVPTPVPGTSAEDFFHLCPSTDVNESLPDGGEDTSPTTWTFTYHVWNQLNCEGVELTAPGDANPNNFTCYVASDIVTQANPNQTANEFLKPGVVTNEILCVSQNTQKRFDFNACEVLPSTFPTTRTLDCGCGPNEAGACACGFDTSVLPQGCIIDPSTCNIACSFRCGPVGPDTFCEGNCPQGFDCVGGSDFACGGCVQKPPPATASSI